MKKAEDINWVILVKLDVGGKEIFLLEMARDSKEEPWTVLGFPSEAKGLEYYEGGYDRKHLQGYESSMSACMHSLFFHPSIVRVAGGNEGLKTLVPGALSIKTYHNVSGWITGLELDISIAKVLWERGKKPSLFEQDRFNKAHEKREVEERLLHYQG